MLTLQCFLHFQNPEDRGAVFSLMRCFSAAMRFAYQRSLEGKKESEILKDLSARFSLNARYAYGALVRAKITLSSCRERGQNPKKKGRKIFCPSLTKDPTAAFGIARRALGFEERLPEHYERLLYAGAFLG